MNDISIIGQAHAQQEALPPEWQLSSFCQIGIVVEDPEAASTHWGSRLGIRSWYRPRLAGYRTRASGVPLDQTLEIVIGYTGRTQIELLSVSGSDRGVFGAPSHRDAPEIHHVGYFVRDIDSRSQQLRDVGLEPSQTGSLWLASNVKTRFAYWDMRETGGGIVELIEQRISGLRIGMPEWLVRLGALTGHFERVQQTR